MLFSKKQDEFAIKNNCWFFFYFIENKYFQLVINAFELLSRDDLFKDLNLKITK